MSRLSLLFAVVGLAGACASPATPQIVSCHIQVIDHVDEPVGGASVTIDSVRIGTTDQWGTVSTELRGPQGRTVQVHVACPENWIPMESPDRNLHIQFLKPITSIDDDFVPIEVVFRCQPRLRPQVLVVRTDGRSDIPVVILGQTVAHTDELGVAQVLVDEEPGSEIQVVLDTSSAPSLRPSMPTRRFAVPRFSQILIFDQKFEERVRKRRKTRNTRLVPRRL